ncbi:multidrug effflux MFS transporter [Humidisolicoccus flavus]|uniref:multidrug effflux MFS transporter n=1 Tax=Humidisolicoccus flavus TaxID=3111414 RepID=UPI00324E0F7F
MSGTAAHPGSLLGPGRRLAYILILGACTALGPFTIDLYLPAFPAVKEEFGIGDAVVQMTLSATMLGFALGQLIVGPLSDRLGRRVPLVVATLIHVLASIGVALAPTIEMLAAFRVLQGLGCAASAVVAMAMVRDMFAGKPLVKMLSRLALVQGLAPILAPIIGSQLLQVTDWRGIFWVLAVYSVLVVAAVSIFLHETLPAERRSVAGHSTLGQRYKAVLGDRVFIGAAIIGGMTFGGLFAYLSTSSLLLQDVYGLSETEFGFVFAICSIGVFLGVQVSARLQAKIGPQWVLAGSTAATVFAGSLVLASELSGFGLFGLVPALFIFTTCVGLSMPCVQVLALNQHGAEAGTAASLLGAMNFGIAGLLSPIVGAFEITNGVPMALVIIAASSVSVLTLWFVVRPKQVAALSD